MATYAIGDIQGCYASLMQLLELIEFSDQDQLWLTGDLVNRGPQSVEVLRFVSSLGGQAISVLGNHDLHLLAVHSGQVARKAGQTLAPVLAAPDCEQLLDWLRQQPLLHDDQRLGSVMVHAGIPHIWTLDQAKALATEVETVLRTDPSNYFKEMYGDQPQRWRNSLKGADRLRVITNYFTRMRFIKKSGRLDFAAKGGLESQPNAYLPWFAQIRKEPLGRRVICGHWAALGFYENALMSGLDTGCVWGNRLSALRLDDGALFSVKSVDFCTEDETLPSN